MSREEIASWAVRRSSDDSQIASWGSEGSSEGAVRGAVRGAAREQ